MDKKLNNYISLETATKYCHYSQEYLSLRARQGKLRAVKIGRNWVTTQKWVKEYLREVNGYKNQRAEEEILIAKKQRRRERRERTSKSLSAFLHPAFLRPSFQPAPRAWRIAIVSALVFVLGSVGAIFAYPYFGPVSDFIVSGAQETYMNISNGVEDALTLTGSFIKEGTGKITTGMKGFVTAVDEGARELVGQTGGGLLKMSRGLKKYVSRNVYYNLTYLLETIDEKIQQTQRTISYSLYNVEAGAKAYGVSMKEGFKEMTEELSNNLMRSQRFVTVISRMVLREIKGFGGDLKFGAALFRKEVDKNLIQSVKNFTIKTTSDLVRYISQDIKTIKNFAKGISETVLGTFKKVPGKIVSIFKKEPRLEIPEEIFTQEEIEKLIAEKSISREELFQLQQTIQKLKEEGLPVKEIIREVTKITEVRPLEIREKVVTKIDDKELKRLKSQITEIQKWEKDIQTLQTLTQKLQTHPPGTQILTAPVYIGSQGIQIGGVATLASLGVSGFAGIRDLGVGGSTSLGETSSNQLTVNATANFISPVTISNTLEIAGNVTAQGNLSVVGDITVAGAQTYSGAASFTVSSTSPALLVNQTGTGVIVRFQDSGNTVFELANQGALTLTSTSTPQMTVRYDASNYLTMAVSSAGFTTLTSTGALALTAAEGLNLTGAATSTWKTTAGQLTIKTEGTGDDIIITSADQLTVTSTGAFSLRVAGTERLAIDTSGSIGLTGDTTITGSVTTTVDLVVQGDVTIDGDLQFLDDQNITGTGTLTINPTGNLYFQATSSYIDESGNLILAGRIDSSKLQYSGNITINASSSTTTTITITNENGSNLANLEVEGDITITGGRLTLATGETIDAETTDQLRISASTSTLVFINDTQRVAIDSQGMEVTGMTTTTDLYVSQTATIVGTFQIQGTTTLATTTITRLSVGTTTSPNLFTLAGIGNAVFQQTGEVQITPTATTTIGASTSTATVLTGYIASNIYPYTDNQYDLGSATYRWQTGYFGTSVIVGSSATLTTDALTFTGAGNITAGAASTWKTTAGQLTIQTDTSGDDIILIAGGNLTQTFATTSAFTVYHGATVRFAIDSSGNIGLTGDTIITGSVTTTVDLAVQGDVTIDGDLRFLDDQNITGTGTLTINPTGNLYFQATSSYIDESGNLILAGRIDSSKLQYSGNITINASSSTTTTITITNENGSNLANLEVEGDITITGGRLTLATGETIDAETTDQLIINSDDLTIIYSSSTEIFRVTGDGVLITGMTTTTDLYVSQTATIVGTFQVSSTTTLATTTITRLAVGTTSAPYLFTLAGTGNAVFQQTGEVQITPSATTTIGASTSTATVLTGYIRSDIFPYQDNTWDLGSSVYRWQTGYFGTSVIVGSSATLTTNALTFTGAGNITAGAASTWKTTDGDLNIKTEGTGDDIIITSADTLTVTSTGAFSLRVAGTERLAIDTSGSITLTGDITFSGSVTTTGEFVVQGTTTLATAGGRVGIGTTTPSEALTVVGNIWGSGNIVLTGTTATSSIAGAFYTQATTTLGSATSTPTIFTGYIQSNIIPYTDAQYTLGSATYRWANLYAATGTFGGGTIVITTNKIDATGALTIEASGDLTVTSTDNIIFVSAGTEIMRIASSTGYVGIGTTTPAEKLTLAEGNFLQIPGNPVHKGAIDNTTCDNAVGGNGCALYRAVSIYVSGKYAYVAANYDNGVEILDISDPANPIHVGAIFDSEATTTYALVGAASIYVSGKYAYVASWGDDGVEILDISDPANPTHVGAIFDTGATELDGAASIYVSGKYAYVAASVDDGVEILDISDPANPTHVGAITDAGATELDGAASIYVSGKYAYIASQDDHGVEILDISDPSNPTHVGSIDNATCDAAVGGDGCALKGARGIYVSGKYAYVIAGVDNGVEILDISDPSNPTHVGAIFDSQATTTYALGGPMSIYVSGKYAYVAAGGDDGVEILDISDPANPTHVGAIFDAGPTELDGPYSIYVSGKYVYVASRNDNGVEILDISGLDVPAAHIGDLAVGTLDVWENVIIQNNLYTQGGLNVGPGGIYSGGPISILSATSSTSTAALTIDNLTGATLFYVRDDGNVGIGTTTPAETLTVVGNIWGSGNLVLTGTSATSSIAGAFYTQATTTLGSATSTPTIFTGYIQSNIIPYADAQYTLGSATYRWANLYAATGTFGGGTIVITTNKIDATGVLTIEASGDLTVTSSDNIIFVSAGTEIMRIASSTGYVGIGTTAPAEKLTLAEGNFLQIPGNPVHKGAITDAGATELEGAQSIFVSGKYAYIAGRGDNGVEILDISDPSNPTHVGSIDDATCDAAVGGDGCALSGAYSIYISGKYAYVTAYGDHGVEILDISDPTNPTHVGAIFDHEATTTYELIGPRGIYVSGKYAYIAAAGDDGIEILDISDPSNPTHVGSIDNATCDAAVGGTGCELDYAQSIYVSGKYAYIASAGDNGVEILDISDPSNPTHVGSIDDATCDAAVGGDGCALNYVMSIYVSGKYAYVASYFDDGVEILDISDPSNPTHVGAIFDHEATTTYALDGAFSIYVSGKYAYVAAIIDDGVQILDISDPANPTHVGAITDTGATELDGAMSIYVSGKYAYVAAYDDHGVEILDISGIDVPTAHIGDLAVGTLDVWENAVIQNNLYVQGGLNVGPRGLYVAGETTVYASSSLAALTVAQAGSGNIVEFKDASTTVFTILDGGNVGIGTTTPAETLTVVGNIWGSGNIVLTGTAATSSIAGAFYTQATTTLGSATSTPVIFTGYVQSNIIPYADAQYTLGSATFRWANLYAATGTFGGTIVITTNKIDATGVLTIEASGDLTVTSSDNIIFVSAGTEIMRIASSTGYVGIGTATPAEKLTLAEGNFLQIPGNPVHKGAIDDNATTALNGAFSIYISGKYAYVAANVDDGVEILDISDPANPTHVGAIFDAACDAAVGGDGCALDGASSIYVSGKYAYVTASIDDGVEILDISDPTNPTHVGAIFDSQATTTYTLDGARGIYVSGKYAYVASNVDDGVEILDISDPTNPTHVGSISSSTEVKLDGASSIYVSGKYAYVTASNDDAVEILDISDPTNPTHVGAITDGGTRELNSAASIYVSGKYAYVASNVDDGVEILDISDPTNPTHVGSIDNATCDAAVGGDGCALDGAISIYVSGKYAYVAAQAGTDHGVEVLDISDPSNPVHVGAIFDDATTELSTAYSIFVSGKYAYVAAMSDDGVEILDISGIDVPAAHIGDLAVGTLDVWENVIIQNNLYAQGGLNVGPGGMYVAGETTIYASSSLAALTVAQAGSGNIVEFKDASTTVFTILDGGNVGIGTTTPTGIFVVATSTGASLFHVDGSGNVGIGTASPGGKLDINAGSDGTIALEVSVGTTDKLRIIPDSGYTQIFIPGSGDHLALMTTGAGNVGIGTVTPSSRLTIASGAAGGAFAIGDFNAQVIDNMEVITDWAESDNGNTDVALETTTHVKVGAGAMKITTNVSFSSQDTITKTISNEDWSSYERLGFWLKATYTTTSTSATTSQIISILFHNSTTSATSTHNITVQEFNEWQYQEWNIGSITNATSVDRILFRIDNDYGSPTFYIDQLRLYDDDERTAEMFVDKAGNVVLMGRAGVELYAPTAGMGSLPGLKVSAAIVEINQPLSVNVAGDVGFDYDIVFTNTGASQIISAGPLWIRAGDPNYADNLYLTVAGTGDVIMDIASSSAIYGGFKILGSDSGGYVTRVAANGDVWIGGTGSGGSDLWVKSNITQRGGYTYIKSLDASTAEMLSAASTSDATAACINNTYYHRLTALNDNGETTPSAPAPGLVASAASSTITVAWNPVSGATKYKLYRYTGQLVDDAETPGNWTANTSTVTVATSTDEKVGTNAVKITVAATTTSGLLAYSNAPSTLDLSGEEYFEFWIKSSIGTIQKGDFKLILDETDNCTSSDETLDIPALAANAYTFVKLAYQQATGNRNSIECIGLSGTNAASIDIYLDDINSIDSVSHLVDNTSTTAPSTSYTDDCAVSGDATSTPPIQNTTGGQLFVYQGDDNYGSEDSTTVFGVGNAVVEIGRPLQVNVAGDVGMDYNLVFMGTGLSQITSQGPLRISAGDANHYENLTLATGGTGDIIMDIASSTIGLKVLGSSAGGYVALLTPTGNLTISQNISTIGGNITVNQLSAPGAPTFNSTSTSGSCADDVYYYRIAAYNDNGTTTASVSSSAATAGATTKITISWVPVSGATGYFIYRSTSSTFGAGDTASSTVITSGRTTTYTDSCAGDTDRVVPSSNTAGGRLAINITSPARRLEVLDTSDPQLRLTQADGSQYAEFKVDAAGDLRITASGDDIKMVDDNLWICSGGSMNGLSCPSLSLSDNGNLVVEGDVYVDDSGSSHGEYKKICPTGWVWIPGNSKFGTEPGFCVMKYEAKCDWDGNGTGDGTASGRYESSSGDCAAANTCEDTDYGTWHNDNTPCDSTGTSTAQVVSTAQGAPIAYISQQTAQSYCQALGEGYHLVSDQEWMTIATDVLWQSENWCDLDGSNCDNAPGTSAKYLASGHRDNNPSEAQDASTSDSAACYATVAEDADATCGDVGSQKRTHDLSTSETVWDIAGNVWEWTDNYIVHDIGTAHNNGEMPLNDTAATTSNWYEYTQVTNYKSITYVKPSRSDWSSSQRIGKIYLDYNGAYTTGDNQSDYHAFVRGGGWNLTSLAGAFTLYLYYSPLRTDIGLGFRCAR